MFASGARCSAVFALALLGGCGDKPQTSDVKFDAAHSVALDGVIDAGSVITSSSNEATIKREIQDQLFYTIGQFNGQNGVADLNRLESTVLAITERADGLYDVQYTARLFIAWPRERAVPANFELILPLHGDFSGLNRFFTAYGSDEDAGKLCLAWEAHDVSMGLFWYYYRPEKTSCPLLTPGVNDPELVTKFNIRLAHSIENTNGKSPEYHKVWEDGRLVATAIFGKNEEGETSEFDAGIAAFRQFYTSALATYGTPLTTNLGLGELPSAVNNDVRLTFATGSGELDLHLYLVNGIRSVDQAFRDKYNQRTMISDFVSYSGHSGLGANIRALARMGHFVPGQYQIFLINGCDTFAYVDNALRQAHQDVNPTESPDRYFDLITNAMPSFFHMNSASNLAVINALIGQTQTYRSMLAGFDRYQRAGVTGEQDNRWPLPFDGE